MPENSENTKPTRTFPTTQIPTTIYNRKNEPETLNFTCPQRAGNQARNRYLNSLTGISTCDLIGLAFLLVILSGTQ